MKYYKYAITEAEYERMKAQYLAYKKTKTRVYYVKELNKLYKITRIKKFGIIIAESNIINGKKELVNCKRYVNGNVYVENCFDGEIRIETTYNHWREPGIGRTIKYYKHGKLHRMDGFAIVHKKRKRNDEGFYYVNGNRVDDEFFKKIRRKIRNGGIIYILNNYNYNDLMIIKTMIEEIGNEKQLEVVNKYLIVKMLEGESK